MHLDLEQPRNTSFFKRDEILSICHLPLLEHLNLAHCVGSLVTTLGSFSFYLICIKNRFCRDMPVMKNMRALSLAGGIMAMDTDSQMGKGSLM